MIAPCAAREKAGPMNIDVSSLKYDERAVFSLRSLYSAYGYSCYKMSKFEEYDLYVRNKDFLVSDSVITFTDTDGRLMALKPDVTLSIIRHYRDEPGVVQKLYYNENVYRVSKKTRNFKEIMQVGLECIGAIDDYCVCEVLMLAAESLRRICPRCVLDIAHLDIVASLIDDFSFSDAARARVLKCIGEKNGHELALLCEQNGVEKVKSAVLRELVGLCDRPERALPKLRALLGRSGSARLAEQLSQLESLLAVFKGTDVEDMLRVDFSVVNNLNYYNGIVFSGFVEGVPSGVLSGGRYDRLMRKMKHGAGAIGFAIYLDQLERLADDAREYDVDTLLLYDRKDDPSEVRRAVCGIKRSGVSVSAQKEIPRGMKFRRLMKLTESGAAEVERDA